MKLSKWATEQGISYTTAYRWFKAGKVPNAVQMENGTILINPAFGDAEDKMRRIRKILEET